MIPELSKWCLETERLNNANQPGNVSRLLIVSYLMMILELIMTRLTCSPLTKITRLQGMGIELQISEIS